LGECYPPIYFKQQEKPQQNLVSLTPLSTLTASFPDSEGRKSETGHPEEAAPADRATASLERIPCPENPSAERLRHDHQRDGGSVYEDPRVFTDATARAEARDGEPCEEETDVGG
jgi:hypothetical protein